MHSWRKKLSNHTTNCMKKNELRIPTKLHYPGIKSEKNRQLQDIGSLPTWTLWRQVVARSRELLQGHCKFLATRRKTERHPGGDVADWIPTLHCLSLNPLSPAGRSHDWRKRTEILALLERRWTWVQLIHYVPIGLSPDMKAVMKPSPATST